MSDFTNLKRLVKEILDPFPQVAHETEGVADDIQTQDEDVELFDGLLGVMIDRFGLQLLLVHEHIRALKVGQPEITLIFKNSGS